MTTPTPLTRRQFAKGVGAVGIGAAVAGCVAGSVDPEGVPPRPKYGRDPDGLDQPLRYVVKSVHYQNSWFQHRGDGLPERPPFPGQPIEYEPDLRFILESLEYQNAYIASEAGD